MLARNFHHIAGPLRRASLLAGVAACLALAACSPASTGLLDLAANAPPDPANAASKEPKDGTDTRDELAKATEYWGKEYAKSPRDAEKALNYARNLKAMGQKRHALAVLQQASLSASANRALLSEYGRLALEFDQISLAQRLLERADDPTNPDWRVISARGTVLAKQGSYRDAVAFYERALALAPGQPSLLNNLALAYAMEGSAEKAEPLLKRAAAAADRDPRVAQNLALVLGLQGKYDEAKLVAAHSLPADAAAANVDYIRSIVLAEARPISPAARVDLMAGNRPALKGPAVDDGGAGWAPQVAIAPAKN
jgi:Flp pilus assembly protein TadD